MESIDKQKLIAATVAVARSFVGEKEVGNNAGFSDGDFQKQMIKSGWERGMPWCAFLVETVFRSAMLAQNRAQLWNLLEPLFSGNAVETLYRFQKKGYTVHQEPKVGDLVVWRFGAGPSGHMGIVMDVTPSSKLMTTVEGNTALGSNDPAQIIRDGQGVLFKARRYGTKISEKKGAFNLLGFVSPLG
jgi:hypothetical protein